MKQAFYYEPLSNDIKKRITGISYPDTKESLAITYEDLAYVHVLHYNFHNEVEEGELICNKKIAEELLEIFQELYKAHYPIEKIRLIDEYGGDDESSMADNNSSCFNYRVILGSKTLSNHAYGTAIDINPLYNPYITYREDGSPFVQPANSVDYVDREKDFSYKIDTNDLCYKLFTEHGYDWGGGWDTRKDYQHFAKELDAI